MSEEQINESPPALEATQAEPPAESFMDAHANPRIRDLEQRSENLSHYEDKMIRRSGETRDG
jgi:hypothetical protein